MGKLAGISISSAIDSQDYLEIWEVPLDDATTIKFVHGPFRVLPTILDEGTAGECYFAEDLETGISAVGVDVDELRRCLHSDIRMTWKRVCRKQSSELTSKDKVIRQRLLKLAEEISNG